MKHPHAHPPAADESTRHWLQLQLSDVRLRPPWDECPDCVRLGFAAIRIDPLHPVLHALHISGVRPERLHALRVHDDRGTVFELESLSDMVGRRVSAGEIMQAICTQTEPGRITVSCEQFMRSLQATRATIELQVRVQDGRETQRIQVHGELACPACPDCGQ